MPDYRKPAQFKRVMPGMLKVATDGVPWRPNTRTNDTPFKSVQKWKRAMNGAAGQAADFLSPQERGTALQEVHNFRVHFNRGNPNFIQQAEDLPFPNTEDFARGFPTLATGLRRSRGQAPSANPSNSSRHSGALNQGQPPAAPLPRPSSEEVVARQQDVEAIYGAIRTACTAKIDLQKAIQNANEEAPSSSTSNSLGQLHHRQQDIYGVSQPAFARQLAARGMRSF
ncbi:hypothetical protein JCM10207_001585 [Rhodosporidiobolus poonsookiae]